MIGSVIGNYEVRDKVGEGGMGAVYRGVDLMLEREVAIKVLRPELANTPQLVERFRIEAVALARLNHPNIATLYSFLRHGDEFLMVMEFVRGETLDSLLRRTGALGVGPAITLFCQALDGIAHAHAHAIIHRDLKPANLMLTAQGTIKVMDFGIARVLGGGRMTRTGRLIGTLEYMSPEQVRGQETDARSDIYSLGIVLYEMLTGQVPFKSDSDYDLMHAHLEEMPTAPRVFAPHLPPAIEAIILRALAKSPADRFQTIAEFRAALASALGVEPTNQPLPAFLSPVITPPETRYAASRSISSASIPAPIPSRESPRADSRPPRQSVFTPLYVKYNWRHYAIVATLIAALGSIWGVIIWGGLGARLEARPLPSPTPVSVLPPPAAPVDQAMPVVEASAPAIQPERVVDLSPTSAPASASPASSDGASASKASRAERERPAVRRHAPQPQPGAVAVQPTPAPQPTPATRLQPTPAPSSSSSGEKAEKKEKEEKKMKEKESKAADTEKAIKGVKEIICIFKRC